MVTRSKRGSGRSSARSYVSKGSTYSKDQITRVKNNYNKYEGEVYKYQQLKKKRPLTSLEDKKYYDARSNLETANYSRDQIIKKVGKDKYFNK